MTENAAREPAPYEAAKKWWDDPVRLPSDDFLDRAPFAEHAASLIRINHSPESSVVYGLEGTWGSGKTSVVNFIETYLAAPKASPWKVTHFTPWATTGTAELLEEFFNAIAVAAPTTQQADKLRRKLRSYADLGRPLMAAIPGVGTAIVEASRVAEKRLDKPWNVAFEEVSAELRALQTPILVIVDDIDRLQPSELLDLLKVVRLLGRFPGVDFLLAYDEKTLVDSLQDPQRGNVTRARARAFMEKIVQYPLSLPPLLNGKIVKLLDAGLTDIVTPERLETTFDIHRFSDVISQAMPSQLTTPRAIERFLAQVREQFNVHDRDEMNDVDLILATFLRVEFPDLFGELQRWKPMLTRSVSGWSSSRYGEEAVTNWDKLLDFVEAERDREDARTVLEALFPAVQGNNPRRAEERRFAHPDYFNRYLAQTIPEGDIADSTVTQALNTAAQGVPDLLNHLLLGGNDERATLVINKIRARYPDISDARRSDLGEAGPITPDLLGAAMTLVANLESRIASWTSPLDQTTFWAANLTRLLLRNDPAAEVDAALARAPLDRSAHVLSATLVNVDEVDPPTKNAIMALLDREAARIIEVLLSDLRGRDESSTEGGNPLLFDLVRKSNLMPNFQATIRAGLAAEEYTLEDIAARLVGFSYLVGGSRNTPSGASFSGDLFAAVTGVPADSTDMSEHGDWRDTSWPRRRAFARRFIKTQRPNPATDARDTKPGTDADTESQVRPKEKAAPKAHDDGPAAFPAQAR